MTVKMTQKKPSRIGSSNLVYQYDKYRIVSGMNPPCQKASRQRVARKEPRPVSQN